MTGKVSIERIKALVAAHYGLPVGVLESQRRDKKFVSPRHVAIYLACSLTPHSSGAIGRMFGDRDHSTILSAHRKIAELRDRAPALDSRIRRFEQDLKPPRDLTREIQLAFLVGPLFDWLHDPQRPQPTLRQLEAA